MPDALESDVLYLGIVDGRVRSDLPLGLTARAAPRKCARGRDRDSLFIALSLRSRSPVPESLYHEYSELAAATYYGVPGSVTAALRQALTAVNARLLEYNLRGAAGGRHVQGHFIGAVLRGEALYLAQAGAGLAVVLHTLGQERFPVDPGREIKPLGISQALDIQYAHTQVKLREVVVVASDPAPGWESLNFAHYAGLPLDELQLRLTQHARGDGCAMAIRFEPAGAVDHRPSDRIPAPGPLPAPGPSPAPQPNPSPERDAAPPPSVPAPPVLPEPFETPAPAEAPAIAPPILPVTPPPAEGAVPPPGHEFGEARDQIEEAEDDEYEAESKPGFRVWWRAFWGGVWPSSRRESVGRGTRAFGRAIGVTLAESLRGLRVLLARVMPEGVLQQDGLFTLPPSVMMGIAIVFPLIVVAIVVVVYVELGRGEQYRAEFAAAQSEVALARTQPDDLSARPHWEAALRHLLVAEAYQQTSEAFALRKEAQGALDRLDGVTRLEFKPAVERGLGRDVSVKRLLAPDARSFYALDAANNVVLRAIESTAGYDPDASFACAAGRVGQFTVGALVDIAELPVPNAINADAIVGFDTRGTLLYCAPNQAPLASELPPPEGGWQSPRAIEVYADRLYVLDPGADQVWQYVTQGGIFSQTPVPYFTSSGHGLGDVVDMTIADGDLYLLHADGHLTVCTRGLGEVAPNCASPAAYVDERPGRPGGDRIGGAVPAALLYDPPPQPSLYFLDTVAPGGSVYQYSLRLVFQRQLQSTLPLFERIDAFAIDPSKQLFIGSGDRVYFAALP